MRSLRLPVVLAVLLSWFLAATSLSAPTAHASVLYAGTPPGTVRVMTVSAPVAAWYKVRTGDALSALAVRFCSQARDWTGIYAASRKAHLTAWNANDLSIGQSLVISCAFVPGMLDRAPAPRPVYTAVVVSQVTTRGAAAPARYSPPAYSPPVYSSGGYPGGAFGQCVVARESGGNSQVMNSTGHYGLYQFSASTWAAYGGNPADFGHASAGEQNTVFATALARGGQSNWSPYDGC